MIDETENYYHKILSVRTHIFAFGLGYIVEGMAQKKGYEGFEWEQQDFVYYYIAQTDHQFILVSGECAQRRSDWQLDQQGLRHDVPIFLAIPAEVQKFIQQVLQKKYKQFVVRKRKKEDR